MDLTVRARDLARHLVPFPLRLELARLRRWPRWILETSTRARTRIAPAPDRHAAFPHLLAEHATPLERVPGQVPRALQQGKEHNVRLAARLIDGLVIRPFEVFSYHRTVGRPSRRRGFRVGLELRDGRPSSGVGGGACQVSNLLYWLALTGGMRIVERHRHGADLFPDHGRTVPFGCGATVFYHYADLRFENPLDEPVLIDLAVRDHDRSLVGALRVAAPPPFGVEVYEAEHRLWRADDGGWLRENRVRRRVRDRDGRVISDEEVAHNRARLLYEPEPEPGAET